MNDQLHFYGQDEYSRILDQNNARVKGLSQTECEKILMNAGASFEQAKNGSYVYLHHGNHQKATIRSVQSEYDNILDNFDASNKRPQECIKYLEGMGYSYGQSKTAVHKFRVKRKLIRT